MLCETEAIILNSRKYSDTSKIISVFSREFGRFSLIAKGARQSKSRFGASLEPLSKSTIWFNKKPQSDLQFLTNAELLSYGKQVHGNYQKLAIGLMIAETISKTQEEYAANEALYQLLVEFYDNIELVCINAFSVFSLFILDLVDLLGYGMGFTYTTDDNQKDFLYISLENFSILDEVIYSKNIFRLHFKSYLFLQKLCFGGLEVSLKLNPNIEMQHELIKFFAAYLSYHNDKVIIFKMENLLNL
ncbi:MAG: DNA repair protein RecO [Candidatus Kapabacteria bacterium]|nr:DNA repair protein RecO [Candidatus Kapabacteria bacterium]